MGATNGDLHVRFSTIPAATQGCVAYQPDHAGIYWGVEFQARGNTSGLGQTQLTSVFIHELGHVLGLSHFPPGTQPPTIMNQTPDCNAATEVNNAAQADAEQAASCLAANCRPTPTPTPVRTGGTRTGGTRTCGYQESVEPTYNTEGDVTGSQVVYTWMCS